MAEHNLLGSKGEKLAESFLLKKGYTVLHSHWRYKHKEVDIIAMDNDCLVIVEVKTRSSDFWGSPEESVTLQKQDFLIQAAEVYIEENEFNGDCRFDIISILVKGDNVDIQHIEQAFYP